MISFSKLLSTIDGFQEKRWKEIHDVQRHLFPFSAVFFSSPAAAVAPVGRGSGARHRSPKVCQVCVRVCVCVCVCACVGGWVDGAQWTLVPGRRRLVEDDARRRNVPQAVAHFFLFRPPLAPARIAILVSFHTHHTHTHTHTCWSGNQQRVSEATIIRHRPYYPAGRGASYHRVKTIIVRRVPPKDTAIDTAPIGSGNEREKEPLEGRTRKTTIRIRSNCSSRLGWEVQDQ